MPALFTLDEAEALLPRLIPILETIQREHGRLGEAEVEARRLLERTRGNGHGVDSAAVTSARAIAQTAAATLDEEVGELSRLGVELKDPSTGLIDFRAMREGRVVYLCWRLGEPRIEWWHDLDAGFAGRQRLERTD